MNRKSGKRRPGKRRPRFEGSLPDGSITTDPEKYVQAWRALAEPIAKEFGWRTIGYEPGIMFSIPPNDAVEPPCGIHGNNIVLSVSVATKLCKLIEEARTARTITQPDKLRERLVEIQMNRSIRGDLREFLLSRGLVP